MPSNRAWYSRLWYLQHFNLFQEFTRDELLPVARLVAPHALARHSHLYQSGDPTDHVYFLIEGQVKIYRKNPSGRRVTLAILQPGEVFGGLNSQPAYEQEAEALEPSTIYALRTQEFRALLARKPGLALQVVRRLGRRQQVLERKIASLVLKDVPTRLAETLLELPADLRQPCDVVLLDLMLLDMEGLEVLHQLRQRFPTLPVLVFSMHLKAQYAIRAVAAGAAGYLTKNSLPRELVRAIRQVVQRGKRYISASLAAQVLEEVQGGTPTPPHTNLSNREYAVLCGLARGKMAKELAAELSVSPKTIATYRARLLKKLHVSTTADLIRYAIGHQLID